MDTFASSPSRLNRKLYGYSNPLLQNTKGDYEYIADHIPASCKELESKMRNLSMRVSSSPASPITSNYTSTVPYGKSFASTHAALPQMNHAKRYWNSPLTSSKKRSDLNKAVDEKDKIISRFCSLSDVAMDKMTRLSTLTDTISSKLNEYEAKAKTSIDFQANHILDYQSKLDSIVSKDYPQSQLKKTLNSIEDLTQRRYARANLPTYSLHTNFSYDRPLSSQRRQYEVGSRDCCCTEVKCEMKMNELKSKIDSLEKELEKVKNAQKPSLYQPYQYKHKAVYSFN